MLDVRPGELGDAAQEEAAGESAGAAADCGGGPVEREGLEVDLGAGEEEVVAAVGVDKDAAAAGDGDDVDVKGRVEDQGDLGAGEGLAVATTR